MRAGAPTLVPMKGSVYTTVTRRAHDEVVERVRDRVRRQVNVGVHALVWGLVHEPLRVEVWLQAYDLIRKR